MQENMVTIPESFFWELWTAAKDLAHYKIEATKKENIDPETLAERVTKEMKTLAEKRSATLFCD